MTDRSETDNEISSTNSVTSAQNKSERKQGSSDGRGVLRDISTKFRRPAPNEWQPIETAPRDGAQIIGYDPEWIAEQRMLWDEDLGEWKFYQANLNYAGLFWGDQPSWWRLAPALPTVRPSYTADNAPPHDPDAPDNDGWSA